MGNAFQWIPNAYGNKAADVKSNYQPGDVSPMSSNVSSFYLDRIEELLPEKKMIAEKLFKNRDSANFPD